MCVLAQIIIGGISYIMRKTRRLKKAATVAAVVAMTATMMPVGVLTNGFGVNKIAYADEQGVAQSKCLILSGMNQRLANMKEKVLMHMIQLLRQ